jgi:hypothetical protein
VPCLGIAIKQRLTFTILTDNSAFLADTTILAKDAGGSDDSRAQEEHAHDDECEDPLESNDLGCKLGERESCAEEWMSALTWFGKGVEKERDLKGNSKFGGDSVARTYTVSRLQTRYP